MNSDLERFAQATGAKLEPFASTEVEVEFPQTQEEQGLEDSPQSPPEDPNYIAPGFQAEETPWKNPKLKMALVGGIGLCVVGALLWIFNGGLSVPTFEGVSLQNSKPADDLDDLTPLESKEGAWQHHALRSGLSPGFEGEADRKNKLLTTTPPAAKKKPPVAKAPASKPVVKIPPAPPVVPSPRRSSPVPPPLPSRPIPKVVRPAPEPQPPELSPVTPQSLHERLQAALAATGSHSSDGGDDESQANQQDSPFLASEQALLTGIPQQLISRSTVARGELQMGIAFSSADVQFLQGQRLDIQLTDSGETGLPEGAVILAKIVLPQGGAGAERAPVHLIPNGIAIGNAEYAIPEGHLMVTGKKGDPLVAKQAGPGFWEIAGNVLGQVSSIVNPLSLIGNGSTTNVITSVDPGRFQGDGQRPQVLYLKPRPVEVRVLKPLSLPENL